MKRFLALLTVALVAGAAVADIPPPPPPKGQKYVSVSNEVVLGKDVTGYVFVQQVGQGPGRPMYTYRKLELTAGKPTAMPGGGKYVYVTLAAVPLDVAKEFKTDADLFAAIEANKTKGIHRVGFGDTTTVPDKFDGDSVKWTHTITAIDPKDGIKKKVEGDGVKQPADDPKKKLPTGAAPLAAGAAAFAALALGGLWIAGRARRRS